jgi:putative chitinase
MKYFTMDEFIRSDEAKRRGIDNTPSESQKNNVIEMVENLLDPLRGAWGEYCRHRNLGTGAIRVSSGIRSAALNAAVGGSKTSAHYLGYAADLVPCNGNLREFKKFCVDWLIDKDFDQFISENENAAHVPEWIHIGYKNSAGKQREQYKYMVDGKYYTLTDLLMQ